MAAPLASKLKIAEHYLLSAPPAQLDEVQKDVVTLLKPAAFDAAGLLAAREAYNVSNNVCAKVADGALPIVLCPEGALGSGHHVDSFRRVVVNIDHGAATLAASEPVDDASASPLFDPAVEALRAPTLAALRAHVLGHYNPGAVGGLPWARGVEVFARDGGLLIITSVTVRNLPNYWSGSWRGRFTVTLGAARKATLAGSLSVRTHYFENGNVQTHDEKALSPVALDFSDGAALGTAVVAAVAAAEGALVVALDDVYETMSSSVLKEVRRFLPVSGQKMNWNAAEHRMRKTLQQSSAAAGGAASS